MFKALVLIWVVSASEPVIIEDKLGPYETVGQCFYRGAVIIRSVFDVVHISIAKAETICMQNKIQKPKKEEGLAL